MAVVDATKDLFHEHGGILLCELTSRHNLVEELTTLTNVGDNVISFVVLKELVHLQDIWMVQILKVVDLIEEHLLFVFVHV